MQIKKGDDRVVVILPALGIVLKFPFIRFWRFVCSLVRCFKNPRLILGRLWRGVSTPIRYPLGFRGMLFKGLHANWCEFWFYWRTRNPFLQPTYFSLFGFLNVQRIGEPCLMKPEDVWYQLSGMNKSLQRDLRKDNHHFANPRNFCFFRGKIRMLDYGSSGSRAVVALHGSHIVEYFNPAYSWEEEKKKFKDKSSQT